MTPLANRLSVARRHRASTTTAAWLLALAAALPSAVLAQPRAGSATKPARSTTTNVRPLSSGRTALPLVPPDVRFSILEQATWEHRQRAFYTKLLAWGGGSLVGAVVVGGIALVVAGLAAKPGSGAMTAAGTAMILTGTAAAFTGLQILALR